MCLARKNSPSISEATRRKIQALAGELGYQPNVAARNLALLRTEKKGGGSLPIAWINQEVRREHWRVDAEARSYLEGAQKRAAESGYHLEEIWTREPGMTAARIVQIVRARGIAGAIFPAHRSFDFSLLNAGWGRETSRANAPWLASTITGSPNGWTWCVRIIISTAIICRERSLAVAARAAGCEAAWVQVPGAGEDFDAGLDACAAEIAAAAVDGVVEKIRRFEHGTRESTRLHLIKGMWQARGLARREVETVVA